LIRGHRDTVQANADHPSADEGKGELRKRGGKAHGVSATGEFGVPKADAFPPASP
jgi:hypothetical protein